VNSKWRLIQLFAILLLLLSEPIYARTARLLYASGDVSVQPHGTDAWVQGSPIRPLTNADNIWADKNSRAELNFGSGLMRMGSETSLTLTNVNDTSVQVELHQGILNVHIRGLDGGEVYQITTPNLSFWLTKAGNYRIEVSPDRDTTVVSVRTGQGHATSHGRDVAVHAGEQAQFSGNSLEHHVRATPRPDSFDDWCQVRDQRLNQAVSASHIQYGAIGSNDLDEYEAWRSIWAPTAVAPGLVLYP
jgi:hypothetical protein